MSHVKRYLEEMVAYFRSMNMPCGVRENALLVSYMKEGKRTPVVIELDEQTMYMRISIPTEIPLEERHCKTLLRKNFFVWGGKLGIDPDNFLFIATELNGKEVLEKSDRFSIVVNTIEYLLKIYEDTITLIQ
jgi:hypothetical protein